VLVDAAQAFGKMAIDFADLGADYLVVSSHKVGGPPGAGAWVLGCEAPFAAPRRGGGQEYGRRPGTENAPAIAGFAAAARAAVAALPLERARLERLQRQCEDRLRTRFPDVVIFAQSAPRLANTTLFALPALRAESALIGLDLEGAALSSGAACASGKVRASRVLGAMGVGPHLSACALRASFGWASTPEDVEGVLEALDRVAARAHASMDAHRGPHAPSGFVQQEAL
jgi:cysteine desulfurase